MLFGENLLKLFICQTLSSGLSSIGNSLKYNSENVQKYRIRKKGNRFTLEFLRIFLCELFVNFEYFHFFFHHASIKNPCIFLRQCLITVHIRSLTVCDRIVQLYR